MSEGGSDRGDDGVWIKGDGGASDKGDEAPEAYSGVGIRSDVTGSGSLGSVATLVNRIPPSSCSSNKVSI